MLANLAFESLERFGLASLSRQTNAVSLGEHDVCCITNGLKNHFSVVCFSLRKTSISGVLISQIFIHSKAHGTHDGFVAVFDMKSAIRGI
jgi:hypothetical protein